VVRAVRHLVPNIRHQHPEPDSGYEFRVTRFPLVGRVRTFRLCASRSADRSFPVPHPFAPTKTCSLPRPRSMPIIYFRTLVRKFEFVREIVFHSAPTRLRSRVLSSKQHALLAAGSLMLVGVWLHLTERHVHLHRHESITHDHLHMHHEHHQHTHLPTDPPGEPHSHVHHHAELAHTHPHCPDIHHRHRHN
jgi:hypothetical protein